MTTDLERLVVQLSADLRRYDKELQRGYGISDRQARRIEQRFNQMNRRMDAIGRGIGRSIVTPLTGITAALGTREIIRYIDAWNRLSNFVRIAGADLQDVSAIQQRIFEIAQETRQPLESFGLLYGRLTQASTALGASQEEIFETLRGVGNSLRIQGSTAQESRGALIQFTQALGGANVRAEEFNSINEGARPILVAVANGLERAGGSVAKLRQLVVNGEVSSREFFKAFLDGSKDFQAQADQAAVTFDQAFTKINNAFTRYIGQTDQSLSVSQRAIAGLSDLADSFDHVADTALQVAAIIAGALIGRALLPMISNMGLSVVAMARMATSLASIRVGIYGLLSAAGPIGLVLGAAAAALALFADTAVESETALSTLSSATDELHVRILSVGSASDEAKEALRQETDALIANAEAALEAARAQAVLTAQHNQQMLSSRLANVPILDEVAHDLAAARRDDALQTIAEAEAALERLRRLRARIDAPGVSGGGEDDLSEANDKFQRHIDAIQRRTRALEHESRIFGQSALEAERARAEFELLEEAKAAGLTVTPQLRKQIDALADAYANATVNLDQMTEGQKAFEEAVNAFAGAAKSVFSSFISDLREGVSATEALNNALDSMADRLTNLAIDAAFNQITGAILGGGGGATGNPLNILPFAKGGIYDPRSGARQLRRYGAGGVSNTAAIFGESGPEAAVPLPDGRSIPVKLSIPRIPGGAAAAPQVGISIVNNGAPVNLTSQRERRAPNGSIDIELVIDQTVARHMTKSGSASQKALKNGYGLSPKLER